MYRVKTLLWTLVLTLVVASVSMSAIELNWQVLSDGGVKSSSASYQMDATLDQMAIGQSSSASYNLNLGFWQNFSSGCCDLPGDFNDDVSVDISDLTAMVDFMFGGGPAASCADKADVNGDNSVDISDLTYRVDFMFGGGPAPVCGTTGM